LQSGWRHPYDDVPMDKKNLPLRYVLIFALLGTVWTSLNPATQAQMAAAPSATSQPSVKAGALDRAQATAILPATVYYMGASAPVQGRNSAGIRFANGKLVLTTLVDASGYSSEIQQTYQGYLLNETQLKIGDKTLGPGAYGFGFIAGNRMVVMDIAGNEILHATTTRDEQLKRPDPLHIIPDASSPGFYRLYLGRNYITLSAAK
jgi:hypothetical protein